MMKNILKTTLMMAGLYSLAAHADVTLNFELSGPDMETSKKTISISRFFARIDDPTDPDTFLLYQAGKFFPLYKVNQTASTYTLLTPEVKPTLHAGIKPKPEQKPEGETSKKENTEETSAAPATATAKDVAKAETAESTETKPVEDIAKTPVTGEASAEPATTKDVPITEMPESTAVKEGSKTNTSQATEAVSKEAQEQPDTTLRLTKKSKTIAGVPCRMVEELVNGKPVMTHCMADKARLGITERETRTLARVFEMARQKDYGWLGTATTDEQFVSIASQDLTSKKTLQLKSHSTEALPAGHLRVPREFKKVPKE